jgi:hypothetical protein
VGAVQSERWSSAALLFSKERGDHCFRDEPTVALQRSAASKHKQLVQLGRAVRPESSADDTPDTVSANFTVTVKGAIAQLNDLLTYVKGLPPGANLTSTVQLAIKDFQAGNHQGTCTELALLVKDATAQRSKRLTSVQKNNVIAEAKQIEAVIELLARVLKRR